MDEISILYELALLRLSFQDQFQTFFPPFNIVINCQPFTLKAHSKDFVFTGAASALYVQN